MYFGFALELSNIDFWNIDLLDTYLDTDIPSKDFVLSPCLQEVFKTCLQDVLRTSSKHVFKTSWRRLQDQQMFAGHWRSFGFFILNCKLNQRNTPEQKKLFCVRSVNLFSSKRVSVIAKRCISITQFLRVHMIFFCLTTKAITEGVKLQAGNIFY